jgi:putative membrane protein
MPDLINTGFVINAIVFAFLGVAIFWISFLVIDRLTPYHLWREIVENQNTALAIVVGAMSLGLCIIIAAAIH